MAAAQDTQPAGCIKLKDAKVTFPIPPNINVGTSVKRDHCFELFSSGSPSFASHCHAAEFSSVDSSNCVFPFDMPAADNKTFYLGAKVRL